MVKRFVVVVTGGREYDDREFLERALDELHAAFSITSLAQGGCPGADALAAAWAMDKAVPASPFRADWLRFGRAAGPIRNGEMLRTVQPDLLVAFPGGNGAADCVKQAEKMGIPVWRPGVDVLVRDLLSKRARIIGAKLQPHITSPPP